MNQSQYAPFTSFVFLLMLQIKVGTLHPTTIVSEIAARRKTTAALSSVRYSARYGGNPGELIFTSTPDGTCPSKISFTTNSGKKTEFSNPQLCEDGAVYVKINDEEDTLSYVKVTFIREQTTKKAIITPHVIDPNKNLKPAPNDLPEYVSNLLATPLPAPPARTTPLADPAESAILSRPAPLPASSVSSPAKNNSQKTEKDYVGAYVSGSFATVAAIVALISHVRKLPLKKQLQPVAPAHESPLSFAKTLKQLRDTSAISQQEYEQYHQTMKDMFFLSNIEKAATISALALCLLTVVLIKKTS